MPEIQGVSTQNYNNDIRTPKNEIDKDVFLKLLAAQLQYQNPLAPMEDKEMINQFAQFTLLEQVTNMSEKISYLEENMSFYMQSQVILQSSQLIGKNVVAEIDGNIIEGQVTAVKVKDYIPYAVVNEEEVPVYALKNISAELAGLESGSD